jgi:outer membrane lipoprotein-sorting protein
MENKMKKMMLIHYLIIICYGLAYSQPLTAIEILQKSDSVLNAPKDQEFNMILILTDSDGTEKVRKLTMIQKGSDKRLIKFLSPSDQRGIAFLDLPDDIMYLYLPAFKKVRRIAGHIKNQKFAGTDFSYNDMATLSYARQYKPALVSNTEDHYILELSPMERFQNDYFKLKMWVQKVTYYPERIEYYDRDNRLWKISERRKIEKINNYRISKELDMHDVIESHRTTIILEQVKFDSGLSNKLFTQRNMKR